MPSFNFIKSNGQSLPNTVAVSKSSLPAKSQGTPVWTHYGPTLRDSFSPRELNATTNYTVTATAPAYTGQRSFYWNTDPMRYKATGTLSVYSSFDSGYGFNQINGATPNTVNAASSYTLEFYHWGIDVAVQVYGFSAVDFRVTINDQSLTSPNSGMNWQTYPSAGGAYFLTFKFPTWGVRKIRIFMAANMAFRGIFCPGSEDVWAAESRFKLAIIGDSYVQGAGAVKDWTGMTSDVSITGGTMAGAIALHTGWDVYNLGQGGTGYLKAPSPTTNNIQPFGHSSRLAALAALPAMDMVMVYGGGNDVDLNANDAVAAATTMWTAIKNARPTTPLVISGIQSGTYGQYENEMNNLNTLLKAAALAHPGVAGYIDQRSNPGKWVTGNGNVSQPNNTGNADMFISSDLIHPTHAGYDYTALRLKHDMADIRI